MQNSEHCTLRAPHSAVVEIQLKFLDPCRDSAQPGNLGERLSSPDAVFGAEPRAPNGFPQFPTLRMASTDTIILLNVDLKKTKNIMLFNIESVTVHLMMLYDLSFSRRLLTVGGDWTLAGNPLPQRDV